MRQVYENEAGDVGFLRLAEVFDGRFAMHAGEQEAEEELHGAFFEIVAARVSVCRPENGHERNGMPMQQGLQVQVGEHEGGVEGGITEPGAFGIEHDETLRADEEVLRAVVAMNEGELCFGKSRGFSTENGRDFGDALGGFEQVGLDA